MSDQGMSERDPAGPDDGTLLQRLWATWRMKYITGLASGKIHEDTFLDLPNYEDGVGNLIVHRGEHCYIVLNLYPYSNGHAMVVPYRKVSELPELTSEEMLEMMQLASTLVQALGRCMKAQGFNLGMNLGRVAGAGIPNHLHLHIVPRWLGDTNFMPVVGETKVLPESLEATFAKVRRAIREVLQESAKEPPA
jgi:ATP adenylyltransferase